MRKQPSNQGRGLSQIGLDQIGVRVLVVGLGVTGVSVVRFLQQYDIGTAVVDSRNEPPGLELIETSYPDVGVFIGGFNAVAFDAATHLIVSPGVSLQEKEIQRAVERGIPVLGDIDLFAVCADAPIACITGSNGKSTVTTLLGEMASKADWDVRVGGNLGTPALDLFSERAADLYVLELSSFQLERTSQLQADVVAVLNISDDHMDRYPDIASYILAKQQIFCGKGIAILNRQDELVSAMKLPEGRQRISFGLDKPSDQSYGLVNYHEQTYLACGDDRVMAISGLKIKGTHNVQNALAAVAMADALSIPREAQITALEKFAGLPHRTQWVASVAGVTWINDSKATNPGACLAAIEGLPAPIILIAGGDGKGADFSVLKTAINERVKRLILIGKDAKRFAHEVAGASIIESVDTIELAVSAAANDAQSGDTVLLSPACASLDQFKNYQQRGERFVAAVRELSS